jgi:hypothetical protein
MRKVIDLECDLPPDENGNPRNEELRTPVLISGGPRVRRLAPGGEWIRTSSSARDRQRFEAWAELRPIDLGPAVSSEQSSIYPLSNEALLPERAGSRDRPCSRVTRKPGTPWASIAVANVGREEFEEAHRGAFAGGRDELGDN